MGTHVPLPARLDRSSRRFRRLTSSLTAGGMMLVGLPLAVDYVVRPGDTLSEIAARHDTTVERLVTRNGLHRSGDRIWAGESLHIPGARPRHASSSHRRARGRIDPHARRIVHYTVRRGDTPSGLAVRFHAWTAELVRVNGPVLRVGERIRIPVVVAAAARARRTHASHHAAPRRRHAHHHRRTAVSEPSREAVRHAVARTARRHGVDPNLALAVAWHESGWQMHHVSPAGAVGAMQVLPSTGRWMSLTTGRRLHLRDLHDNVTAGVMLLDVLTSQAPTRVAVAGYYQGLAGVRRHGMYRDTKRYVADVLALARRFDRGDYPQ